MNSDPDDTFKRPRDPNEPDDDSTLGCSPSKKLHGVGPNEHAKPKRRRRGKKRKHRKLSGGGAPSGDEHAEECSVDQSAVCEKHCMTWDSDEEDIEVEDIHVFSDVIIRPTDVPKAPENSTSYIIDDHNECRLYWSFENPNRLQRYSDDSSDIVEPPESENAAYNDIDYEYESPHDFNKMEYYDQDFEQSYKNSRLEELMRLSREELISGLQQNEERAKNMHDYLMTTESTAITLERLQSRLLEEQERHSHLLDENLRLSQHIEEISGGENDTSGENIEDMDIVPPELKCETFSASEEELVKKKNTHGKLNKDLRSCEDKQDVHERLSTYSNSPRDAPLSQYCEEKSVQGKLNKDLNLSEDNQDLHERLSSNSNSPRDEPPQQYIEEKYTHGKLNKDLISSEDKQDVVRERLSSNSNSPRDEPLSQYCEDSLIKQTMQSALNVYNQKENSQSPCHVPCLDASNKENACYDDITYEERLQTARCTPRHESCNDSCSEHIRVKEKGILRNSEFNDCEEMPHSTVTEEHEMNVVTV